MVTITKSVWMEGNRFYREASGLSTDAKPTDGFANGSRFYEMDTSKLYRFDEANKRWLAWSGSGGGGDDPSGNIATDSEVDEALDTLYPN